MELFPLLALWTRLTQKKTRKERAPKKTIWKTKGSKEVTICMKRLGFFFGGAVRVGSWLKKLMATSRSRPSRFRGADANTDPSLVADAILLDVLLGATNRTTPHPRAHVMMARHQRPDIRSFIV